MKRDIEITYACGHTGTVTLSGKADYIEWKAKQIAKKICPECKAEAAEAFHQKVVAENKEAGMIELTGSEKQISWAEEIRYRIRKQADEYIQKNEEDMQDAFERLHSALDKDPEVTEEKKNKLVEEMDTEISRLDIETSIAKQLHEEIMNQSSSSWLIDHRGPCFFREECINRYYAGDYKKAKTFVPETVKFLSTVLVEVRLRSKRIESAKFYYPKNDTFINLMKYHGASWSGSAWKITYYNNASQYYSNLPDQIASAIANLVSSGFAVKVANEDIIQLLDAMAYTVRGSKNVTLTNRGRFWIEGVEGEEAETIRMIHGVREHESGYSVPGFQAASVEDFAAVYGYYVSKKALLAIDEQKAEEVEIFEPKKRAKKAKGSVKDIMKSTNGILDDLRDED